MCARDKAGMGANCSTSGISTILVGPGKTQKVILHRSEHVEYRSRCWFGCIGPGNSESMTNSGNVRWSGAA